jgi:hypothetical protein
MLSALIFGTATIYSLNEWYNNKQNAELLKFAEHLDAKNSSSGKRYVTITPRVDQSSYVCRIPGSNIPYLSVEVQTLHTLRKRYTDKNRGILITTDEKPGKSTFSYATLSNSSINFNPQNLLPIIHRNHKINTHFYKEIPIVNPVLVSTIAGADGSVSIVEKIGKKQQFFGVPYEPGMNFLIVGNYNADSQEFNTNTRLIVEKDGNMEELTLTTDSNKSFYKWAGLTTLCVGAVCGFFEVSYYKKNRIF